jgi:hypothetical protein
MKSFLQTLTALFLVKENTIEAALKHLSKPILKWKTQLGCGTIACAGFKGKNELALSENGLRLYVTLDDGSLALLDTSMGSIVATYTPSVLATGWTISNTGSGVSVSRQQVGDLVYAVQDSPPPFRWNDTFWYRYEGWYQSGVYNNSALSKLPPLFYPPPVESSRIISLDSNGAERWTYTIQGLVVGSPIHGGDNISKLVYVLHNVNNKGQFTVLRETNDSNGKAKVEVLYKENSTFGFPYSPVRIIPSSLIARQDVLYWFETMNNEPGYDQRGKVHRIIVKLNPLQIYSTQARHEFVGSATRPLLTRNGTAIWVGGYSSRIHKLTWQPDGPFWKGTNSSVDWSVQMDRSLRNETMPVMASPVVSSNGQLLFVPSTTTSFYCINAMTGAVIWKLNHQKRSIYTTEAKLSPDDAVVYSVLVSNS